METVAKLVRALILTVVLLEGQEAIQRPVPVTMVTQLPIVVLHWFVLYVQKTLTVVPLVKAGMTVMTVKPIVIVVLVQMEPHVPAMLVILLLALATVYLVLCVPPINIVVPLVVLSVQEIIPVMTVQVIVLGQLLKLLEPPVPVIRDMFERTMTILCLVIYVQSINIVASLAMTPVLTVPRTVTVMLPMRTEPLVLVDTIPELQLAMI